MRFIAFVNTIAHCKYRLLLTQAVLPEQLHSARLWALVACLLRKCHARADRKARKAVIEHAIAMKVDFAAIARFQKPEFAGFIQPHDGSDRLGIVDLDLSFQLARLILKLPPRPLESIVDGKRHIRMSLIVLCRVSHIDFAAAWKRQMDVDLIERTRAVMASRRFEHNPAGRYSTETLLEICDMLPNRVAEFRAASHTLEIDLD